MRTREIQSLQKKLEKEKKKYKKYSKKAKNEMEKVEIHVPLSSKPTERKPAECTLLEN